MLLALWSTVANAGDCPANAAELAEVVSEADTAFASMDLDAFREAELVASNLLRCMSEPLTPGDAAGVHRLRALAAFVAEDDAGTVSALRALLSVQPGYQFPESLAPEGTPLAQALDSARAAGPGPTSTLTPPDGTFLVIDGTDSAERPLERPFVLQSLDGRTVTNTRWLAAGVAPPAWAHVDVPVPHPRERTPSGPRGLRTGLFVASGVAAALAGGTYGYALSSHASFEDPKTPLEDLEGLRGRTNGALAASATLGGIALGTSGAAVATWAF